MRRDLNVVTKKAYTEYQPVKIRLPAHVTWIIDIALKNLHAGPSMLALQNRKT